MDREKLHEARMKLISIIRLKREVIQLSEFCELDKDSDFEEVNEAFDECQRRLISFIESKLPEWTEEARKEIEKYTKELEEVLNRG
jgi:hypothetical protein